MSKNDNGESGEFESDQTTQDRRAAQWREEGYVFPSAKFIGQANASDPSILERFSEKNFPECFNEFADLLTWDKYWHTTLDTSNAPFWKWFVGGRLNASYNCVDRHLKSDRNKAAIIFVPEPEDEPSEVITYQELYWRVNEFAALLKGFCGVETGDVATIYMPMSRDMPVAMLACARLGVVHNQVFGGFSGVECGKRIGDAKSKILVTIDGWNSNGVLQDLKAQADEAVARALEDGVVIEKVLVFRRNPGEYASKSPMVEGRDFFVDEMIPEYKGTIVDPVSMPAEAPLFLIYSSGITGKPRGCQHSTGGYLSYVAGTSKYYEDIHPDDTYWTAWNIRWNTGFSNIVYGPLALGTTTVMYEGVPTYPDAGRLWRIAERLGVTIFHTNPTTIQSLRRIGPNEPAKYDYHFKHMTLMGEPVESDLWRWHYEVVGKGQAVIADTWWHTENGGFLGSTLPALNAMKPGSCGPAVLGIYPEIRDEKGDVVEARSDHAGNICIRNPWPGIFQTIWGDPDRFVKTYYEKYNEVPTSTDWHDWPYFANDDVAVQGEDGYYRILGRVDNAIYVAGHRMAPKELESAALMVDEVAEAAVVPVLDEVQGHVIEMYIVVKSGVDANVEVVEKVRKTVGARVKNVWIVADLPKTRSGTIVRRVIASISNFTDVGDVTTLTNPDVVKNIQHLVQSEKLARGEQSRDLSSAELQSILNYGAEE
jgi:acetyl-CoA synthetase